MFEDEGKEMSDWEEYETITNWGVVAIIIVCLICVAVITCCSIMSG